MSSADRTISGQPRACRPLGDNRTSGTVEGTVSGASNRHKWSHEPWTRPLCVTHARRQGNFPVNGGERQSDPATRDVRERLAIL